MRRWGQYWDAAKAQALLDGCRNCAALDAEADETERQGDSYTATLMRARNPMCWPHTVLLDGAYNIQFYSDTARAGEIDEWIVMTCKAIDTLHQQPVAA